MSIATSHQPAAYVPLEVRPATVADYIGCILEGRPFPIAAVASPVWSVETVGEGIARIIGTGARG